jgi:hypothetical protein
MTVVPQGIYFLAAQALPVREISVALDLSPLPIDSSLAPGHGPALAREGSRVRDVQLVDFLIDLIGRQTYRRHIIAHFIPPVCIYRYRWTSIHKHLDRGSRSYQTISVHVSW